MLRPSYADLVEVLNRNSADVISSRYSIVIVTAKRARQLVAGAKPLTYSSITDKPVSVAVNELFEEKIIVRDADDEPIEFDEQFESTEM